MAWRSKIASRFRATLAASVSRCNIRNRRPLRSAVSTEKRPAAKANRSVGTGLVSAKATKYLSQATKSVEAAGAPTNELNQAVGLIAAEGTAMPNGIAFDAAYNYALATEVYPAGHSLAGQERYPSLGFGAMENWRGLRSANSSTVSGRPELADTLIHLIRIDSIGAVKGKVLRIAGSRRSYFLYELLRVCAAYKTATQASVGSA